MCGDEVYGDDVTSGVLDHFGRMAEFRLTRAQARERHCCVRCLEPVDDDWTTIDLREWEISALCGQCFDAITEEME